MVIRLKDGSEKVYEAPLAAIDIEKDISEGLLRTVIEGDCDFNVLTFNDEEGRKVFRHTTAHVLAQAVKRLYPEAKCTIGPAIEDGFYYDFDISPLSREDLDAIEKEMKKIIKENPKISRFELPREEAIKLMEDRGETFKVEMIGDLPEDTALSFYQQGEYIDMCTGPHMMSMKPIKAFKLTSSSMAYWRGDEKKARLQRIYGTSYTKKADLEERLKYYEKGVLGTNTRIITVYCKYSEVDIKSRVLEVIIPEEENQFHISFDDESEDDAFNQLSLLLEKYITEHSTKDIVLYINEENILNKDFISKINSDIS